MNCQQFWTNTSKKLQTNFFLFCDFKEKWIKLLKSTYLNILMQMVFRSGRTKSVCSIWIAPFRKNSKIAKKFRKLFQLHEWLLETKEKHFRKSSLEWKRRKNRKRYEKNCTFSEMIKIEVRNYVDSGMYCKQQN